MKLHYRMQNAQHPTNKCPVVLIHGLFGTLDNLGVLGRDLQQQHDVIQVDQRNHGLSPRSPEMNYGAMAQDLRQLLDALEIEQSTLIGHSMGGKTAMALSALIPERISRIVAIDIAPVDYQVRRHDTIFTALNAVTAAGLHSRAEAAPLMRQYIDEEGVVQFLLKSFHQGEWRFNVPVLWDQYEHIIGWETVPAWHKPILFIRGAASPCLDDRYRAPLLEQFPQAKAHVIAGCGHWVHAEKPDAVLRAIHRFFDETDE